MAIEFASLGAKVTCTDLNEKTAAETAEMIKKEGGKAQSYKLDVTSTDDVKSVRAEATKEFGYVCILINNAGIAFGKKLMEATNQQIELTFKVNSIALAYTVKEFLPDMLKHNKGHIVTVASTAGFAGAPGLADYCGSKFAAVGFDESIRLEMKEQGAPIKTTAVCPYFINTGMFEGVKSNLPLLLPILDQHWVAKRVALAVRQNEDRLVMPWFCSTVFLLRGVLPVWLFDKIAYALEDSVMDNFQGRHEKTD